MSELTQIVGDIRNVGSRPDDLFISCASYEPRTTATSSRLAPSYCAANAIICRAIEYLDKGKSPEFFHAVSAALKGRVKGAVEELPFHLSNPIDFVRQLGTLLTKLNIGTGITVDISTFPRRELFMLLHFLQSRYPDVDLRLLYSEPGKYATESGNEEEQWLTRGVRAVEPIPGFCGIQYPQRGSLLVIILGHEGERTHITLRRHQPDRVIFLGQGREQFHSGLREIAEEQNKQMIEQYGAQCFWDVRLSAHGVQQTAIELDRIFQQHRFTHNMFVAPNGTKLQALGVYLAAKRNPEIQITYAVPVIYNWEAFSVGEGKIWELRLGELLVASEAREDALAVT